MTRRESGRVSIDTVSLHSVASDILRSAAVVEDAGRPISLGTACGSDLVATELHRVGVEQRARAVSIKEELLSAARRATAAAAGFVALDRELM